MKELPVTTGPEKTQEAVNVASTDDPDERDVRDTRDEQHTPAAAGGNGPEAVREDVPEDVPEVVREDGGLPTGTTGTGTMGGGDTDPDVSGPLLAEAEELRSSWQRILAGFVDDPRGSVARAATMVEETTETLVATIQERERVLRGAWEGNGAAGDTEKLRIALGKYRAFFEKITRL